MDVHVDVDALVSRYEVTSAPVRDGGQRLRLVWVRPPEVELELESEPGSERAGLAGAPGTSAAPGPLESGAAIAMLDAYRVTFVPGHRRRRAAS